MTSTPFRDYPYWKPVTLEDATDQIQQITRLRKDDIALIQNLPNVFISGRSVGRVPASSADIISGDKVGDFNVTSTYAYYLINDAGTGKWVRVAMGAF